MTLFESIKLAYQSLFEAVNLNKNYFISTYGENNFQATKSKVNEIWNRNQMSTFIKKADKLINYLYFIELQEDGSVNDDVMHVLHDMASANRLNVLDKLNSDVSPNMFKDFIRKQKQVLENLGGLTKDEECIWLRVKTLHDFGDGFKWVVAVDENGEVTGYIPSSITQKTAKHCGNEPSREDGDKYYELRKDNKPYITVILDREGKVAESKPIGNNKNSINFEEVKEYFKWLLEHDDLTGVGERYDYGYAPDQNYGVKDFVGHDDDFVDRIAESKPNILGEKEKYIIELKRKYQANQISKNDVIELFEINRIYLWELRAILGEIPFSEDDLIKYIESHRLKTDEIANTNHKLLTRRIQEKCLEYDDYSGRVLMTVFQNVPRNIVDAKLIIENQLNCISQIPEEQRITFLKEHHLIQSFGKCLEADPSNIGYIPREKIISFLKENNLIESFGKGLEIKPTYLNTMSAEQRISLLTESNLHESISNIIVRDPRAITYILVEKRISFLKENGLIDSFGKGLEQDPGAITYIPEEKRISFLIENNLIDSFGKGLEKDPTNAIVYIPEEKRISFLIENNLIDSFGKGLEKDPRAITYIPREKRISFLKVNNLSQYFGKGLETYPRAIEYIPREKRISFLIENNLIDSFGKGLEKDPRAIVYIPAEQRTSFLKESNLIDSFGKGLEKEPDAITYIPREKRISFLKENNLIDSFGKGLEQDSDAIEYIPEEHRHLFT